MRNIEFYTCDGDAMYITEDGDHCRLTEESKQPIEFLIESFREFYPKALAACEEIYKPCRANQPYYRFRIASRLCNCNFGKLDPHKKDVDSRGYFHMEDVYCPLRKRDCKHVGVICHPEFNSRISASEMRVLKLMHEGVSRHRIAETLCLSPCTINNHIQRMLVRLDLHSEAELLVYAVRHNLIEE